MEASPNPILASNESVVSASPSDHSTTIDLNDEMGVGADQLFFVSTYTNFETLAHGPRGQESKNSIYVYRFQPSDGSLVLVHLIDSKDTSSIINPAFSRFHPRRNIVYTCTEDCENNGQIFAYSIDKNGMLKKIGQADAGGTSTCYLTLDFNQRNLIATNYWNSTLTVIPLDTVTGEFTGPIKSMFDLKGGKENQAAAKKSGGVNHSLNDDSTIAARQRDPHAHALVLDPFCGCVAYVPDLGKDLIRELLYDRNKGEIQLELNYIPSGRLLAAKADGPRYIEFHPYFNTAYAVNELSSTITVFAVDKTRIQAISKSLDSGGNLDCYKGSSTLSLIQSISTLPDAFPTRINTCGRVAVHPTGRFVIVSNRGHDSITIFRVIQNGPHMGQLAHVGFFHTRGETPRHFQFDTSGQFLIVANQDSDCISVFSFNLCTGAIKYTGNSYSCPSPNFICCCPVHDEVIGNPQAHSPVTTSSNTHCKLERNALILSVARNMKPEISTLKDNEIIWSTTVQAGRDALPISVPAIRERDGREVVARLNSELAAVKEQIRMLNEKIGLMELKF